MAFRTRSGILLVMVTMTFASACTSATTAPGGGSMSWDEFVNIEKEATATFVRGDASAFKALWSRGDDVTIMGAFGGYERGWAIVAQRLDWAASMYGDGWVQVADDTIAQ